jgi:hypothetical protein
MKNDMPAWLLAIAVLLFLGAFGTGEEEFALIGLVMTVCSMVAHFATLRAGHPDKEIAGEMELRLRELERRVGLTEGELDVANEQLQRLRAEREFDRALAAPPAPAIEPGTLPGPR